jgi:non-heme chloroperoxidase
MTTGAGPVAPRRLQLAAGLETHYLAQGEGEPVVLLHGGMGDCGSWSQQLPALAAAGFRAVAYSRRYSHPNRNGEAGQRHSLAVDVQDLAALCEALGLARVHLVGTSYGALVALAFALRHPAAVRSLVLCEPPLHPWAARTAAGAQLQVRFLQDVWLPAGEAFRIGRARAALQLLTDGMWGRPVFESLAADRVAGMLRNSAAMNALVQSAEPFPDLPRAAVAALALPALLVQGEQASALHALGMRELAGVLPAAPRAVIPAAGHGSPWENPAAFNASLLAFLGRLPLR